MISLVWHQVLILSFCRLLANFLCSKSFLQKRPKLPGNNKKLYGNIFVKPQGICQFWFHILFSVLLLLQYLLKGYLHFKMITSQNALSKVRPRLRIFLSHQKVMLCSWDLRGFVFLTIPWFIKSVVSWWVLVHVIGCNFWINPLNHNSLTHQTWSIDKYKQGQHFSEFVWAIWATGAEFQTLFNWATCSKYLITNYVKFPVFYFFKRVNKGELKW